MLSSFVQVTVVPTGTWIVAGWNCAVIVSVTWVTPTTGLGEAVGGGGAGTVALPPPQLTNSTTQLRSSTTTNGGSWKAFPPLLLSPTAGSLTTPLDSVRSFPRVPRAPTSPAIPCAPSLPSLWVWCCF